MKWKIAVAIVVLIAVVGPVAAKDQVRTVIEEGVLTSVSQNAVTEVNLRSGQATISYFDGEVFSFELTPRKRGALVDWPDPIWVQIGSALDIDAGTHLLGGPCGSQAQAVTAAVALVEAACSGSGAGSESCIDAQTALDSANQAYQDCRAIYYQQQ